MAMRDEIFKAIMAGGATKESLLELTGTTEKGLASQFTYLRMMGKCPKKQEDGTFTIVSAEEWEAHRAAGGSGKTLTPEERVEKARKRSTRAATAYDNAQKKAEANPEDRLCELKFIKAEAEFEIAEIELGKAEAAYEEAPESPADEDAGDDENTGEEVEGSDDGEESVASEDELQ